MNDEIKKEAIKKFRKEEFDTTNKETDNSNENIVKKKNILDTLISSGEPNNKESKSTGKSKGKGSDRSDRSDRSTNLYHLEHLSTHFNNVFGDTLLEKVLKHFLTTKNTRRTLIKLSEEMGQNRDSLRVCINRHKAYFVDKSSKGVAGVIEVDRSGIEEINNRIKAMEAEKVRIIQEQEKAKSAKMDVEKWMEKLHKVAVEVEVEREGRTIILDFNKVVEFDHELADELLDKPSDFIDGYLNFKEGKYTLNIKNLPDSCKSTIEDLRHKHLNKLSIVEGRVAAISEVRPQVVEAKFECPSCGTIISVLQVEKKFREPQRCSCGRKGGFTLIHKTLVDAARIIIEDMQEKTDNPYKKRVSCFIQGDLTHREKIKVFAPGNEVKVTGVLKEVPIPLPQGSISTRFDYAFELLDGELSEQEVIIEKFSKEEAKRIKELSKLIDDEGLKEITSSFAPEIEGHEAIKQAIICQLCNARNHGIRERNKPNILLIGDPGMAKSVLGKFAINITPGSQKAVGGSASAVGITASIVKEDADLGGWRVEPGALVNAKDLLFLDELNNLSDEDKPRLQEGLSEQTITINKANIHTSMKVSAGVIAAANPLHGHFNAMTDITQQFNITSPILNRFDTIFVIRDKVDKEVDRRIAKKMLQRTRNKIEKKYDEEFLRKFFVYIKQQPEPEIDEKMEDHLSDLYAEIRQGRGDKLIINARFVESMTRLLKASAKIRLSKKIEEKDIVRALDILKHSHYATSEYQYFKEHLI